MVQFTADIRLSAPIPSLNLPKDSSLQDVLEAMAAELARQSQLLESEIYPAGQTITTDDIKYTGDHFSSNGLSPTAAQFEGSPLKVETIKNANDIELKFKATDFDIPADSTIASSTVNITGGLSMGRTQILNTIEPAMNQSIGYARFPVTLDARVVVTTPKGDVELKKSVTISSDGEISQEIPYEVIDRTTNPKPTNLTELAAQISDRLKIAERKKV